MTNRIVLFVFGISFLFIQCTESKESFHRMVGQTMGTTYSIIYKGYEISQDSIDLILEEINSQVSTYIPNSDISIYNVTSSMYMVNSTSNHFIKNWALSQKIYRQTDGYFDPTVMPLINYWGFGYTEKQAREVVDSNEVSAMMEFVGLDKLKFKNFNIEKPGVFAKLDFSAIAKGYAVDVVSDHLYQRGITNFLVEIGGENKAEGLNQDSLKWSIGLNTPKSDAALNDFILVLELSGQAVATSGNYRNFYTVDGKTYGHTINPKTGYPSLNELLSVSVVTEDCMSADAYATAFLAMGLEKAKVLVEEIDGVEACFFVEGEDGNINKIFSDGFIQYVRGE